MSVKKLYGSDARLNFKLLLDSAFREAEPKIKEKQIVNRNSALAYIDFGSQWLSPLSNVLSTVGYKLRAYGPHIGEENLVTPWIIIDCLTQYYMFQRITVASGRGDLVPLYEHLTNKGREVEVMAFPGDLSSQVPKYVTRIIELDDSVLWDNKTEKKATHV